MEEKKEEKKTQNKQSNQLKNTVVKKIELKLNFQQIVNRGFLYVLIGILFLPFLLGLFGSNREEITLSQLVKDLRAEKIEKIAIAGDELRASYKDDEVERFARKEAGVSTSQIFANADIDLAQADLKVENISGWQLLFEAAINFLPVILMIVFFFFIFRQARGGAD
ncbi:MAG TPA: ATP-dependent metallopeptidase FtsH/Yme1/Tma family protein, partial [Candidatus Woesebacteria bacterium]|nr:ATP-dependent metallopeptidase FtsH/Yme1/Tma family protein [Candidatus Woesebacteria bacterium]